MTGLRHDAAWSKVQGSMESPRVRRANSNETQGFLRASKAEMAGMKLKLEYQRVH